MEYPSEFSAEAQAAVEHEMLLANGEFEADREFIDSSYERSKRELILLIYNYIGRVLLAFAKESCALGCKRVWTVPKVRTEVDDFIKQIAAEAERDKCFFSDGKYLQECRLTDSHSDDVSAAVMNQLRNLPQWKEYQKQLLEVTRIQREPLPLPTQRKAVAELDMPIEPIGTASTFNPFNPPQPASEPNPTISERRIEVRFPVRAEWLRARLKERAWDKNDVLRCGGPDVKTVQKMLDGRYVREGGLEKLVMALNHKKIGPEVELIDIPSE